LAVALLLLYPFAFYLFGVVYSDALFLVAALGAFLLLERDRPLLAGLFGAVATAARPVGVAVAIGLALRVLELRGVLRWPLRPSLSLLSRLRPRDAGVLVSGLGFVAFALYCRWRFGEPLAFMKVGASAGWYRDLDLRTIAKVNFFLRWRDYGLNIVTFWLTVQGLLTVAALALVPAVVRRFGWGYAAYVVVSVGMAAVSSSDFVGMGRYVLVAFPVFAALAGILADSSAKAAGSGFRRWLPAAVLGLNALLLAWMANLFARWYFLA
jgi:hypothetical protein